MKKSLIYPIPVLLTIACGEPLSYDPCLLPPEESLQSYYDFISGNYKVLYAAGFCSIPRELQERIWDKIQEAEETGLPPAAPLPASYLELLQDQTNFSMTPAKLFQYQPPEKFFAEYKIKQWNQGKLEEKIEVLSINQEETVTKIGVTKEEAYGIYAAHVAHSLWLEINKIVPWSISEYNLEQLLDLFNRNNGIFGAWNDETGASFKLILNHSPRETFYVAMEAASYWSDQKSLMDDIIKSTRPFRHGAVELDPEGNIIGGDPVEIITISGMNEEKISRHGCQTMSHYIVALARSLNIQGRYINGYYYAAGHRSALFDFTDDVLAHGDDVYYYNILGNTPSSEVMGSHDFWEEKVLVYPKEDKTASHNSMLHSYRAAIKYPARVLIKYYCEKGRESLDQMFLHTEFGAFATVEEIDALEENILQLSNNCTPPLPENNPDN